ncbi:MAG TPA: response regulator [Pyrinomonadaceae bacterium]
MTAKCRVLYVDDHEDSAFMFKQLLSLSDYEVSVAVTMAEALTRAKSEEFDLYVLDKRLPDGTGVDLCRQLNQITPDVPVIFYSGDAYELHRQEAFKAGARAYVTKPAIDKLIDTVHQLLSERECATANA